jgi:predicted dehydrogenase
MGGISLNKIRIGLIGAGGIASTAHFKALRNLNEELSVTAVADVNFEAAKSLAQQFQAQHAFENYQDLLELNKVDAVLITVPNFLHSHTAIDAMEAGKHVLCEKPMAVNAIEATRMVNAESNRKNIDVGAQ